MILWTVSGLAKYASIVWQTSVQAKSSNFKHPCLALVALLSAAHAQIIRWLGKKYLSSLQIAESYRMILGIITITLSYI